jgi:hypothetical protein
MKHVVIAQQGWIFVGEASTEGDHLVLTDAAVLERWGTTEGLGQLAHGPLPGTRLRPLPGRVRVHHLAVVADLEFPEWP